MVPVCPYCRRLAKYYPVGRIFNKSTPGAIWRCDHCDASVACHTGTKTPMGTLATSDLRKLRALIHQSFDQIVKIERKWMNNSNGLYTHNGISISRRNVYERLAMMLNCPPETIHISILNREQAEMTLDLLKTGALANEIGPMTREFLALFMNTEDKEKHSFIKKINTEASSMACVIWGECTRNPSLAIKLSDSTIIDFLNLIDPWHGQRLPPKKLAKQG